MMNNIKKHLLLCASMMLCVMLSAQTQQGYVKTKGRMVDGQLVPGQGLKGATVCIKGKTAVLVNKDDGAFSFPVPEAQFRVDSVRKNGYQLIDMDALSKTYKPSANPIYLVMETPEQQLQDDLDSERKIRRTLQRKLEKREEELEALKAQNKLSQEEHQKALKQLYADQENNDKLISAMAKEYARMDFDQMNELNQRINDAILNGRLTEADSLLRSKGNINSRIAEVRTEQQAEAEAEMQLNQAKAGTQRKVQDIAEDCKQFFDRFKLDMEFDSAAVYIELRANLDTTNVEWQNDAASYMSAQNRVQKAKFYYTRALALYRQLATTQPETYDLEVAKTLDHLARIQYRIRNLTDAEALYLEALSICERLSENNIETGRTEMLRISILGSLVDIYSIIGRTEESDRIVTEQILPLFIHLSELDPKFFNTDFYNNLVKIITTIGNASDYLYITQQYDLAEEGYLEMLEVTGILEAADTTDRELGRIVEFSKAACFNSLGRLYQTTNKADKAEESYKASVEILRRLAKTNPQSHEPTLAQVLSNLASFYNASQRLSDSEETYREALELYMRYEDFNPLGYQPRIAEISNALGDVYIQMQRLDECERMRRQALDKYDHLVQADPEQFTLDRANAQYLLGFVLLMEQQPEAAIPYFEKALEYYNTKGKGAVEIQDKRFFSLLMLSIAYGNMQDYDKAYSIGQELLPILKERCKFDPTLTNQYALTLGNQSFYAIFKKEFAAAEQLARESLSTDPTVTSFTTNLAAALLFQGKYNEAEAVYRQYKDELKNSFLQDFVDFEAAGVIPEKRKADVERIREMLMEE